MDCALSPEQRQLQEAARRFVRQDMRSAARQIEEDNEPLAREYFRKYADLGFLGINLERGYGGQGLSNLDALLVLEEFARVHTAIAFPVFESCVGPVKIIERYGTATLKERVIPQVCKGEVTVAAAMSEADAGSALTDLRTGAEVSGSEIVVNGAKRWCSGGGHAEGYLVYCRFSDVPGSKGIGAVYVEKDRPGMSFGRREALLGFRGVYSAEIYLDNVRVPKDNLVMPEGFFGDLMETFNLERCGNATMCLGLAAGALEDALAYVQERRQFGKPIIDFQAVQLRLAEMAMQVEASRLLIHKAVTTSASGFPSILDSSIAKCFANEAVREVCGNAMQLMGAYGYSKEFPAEQRFRDGWGWGIAGGTIDIQKVNIAAALAGRRFSQRTR